MKQNSIDLEKEKKRYYEIDYAKAIGIFMVVLGHVIALQDSRNQCGSILLTIIYSCHMPLFFIISGICYGFKIRDGKTKIGIVKNIKSLILPYYFWSYMYILVYMYQHVKKWNTLLLHQAIFTVTGRGLAPLWFLISLFAAKILCYFFTSIIEKVPSHPVVKYGSVLLILLIISEIMYYYYMKNNFMDLDLPYLCIVIMLFRNTLATLFMWIGIILGESYAWISAHKKKLLLLALAIYILALKYFPNSVNMHLYKFTSLNTFLVTGIVGTMTVILFSNLLPEGLRITSAIGKSTKDIMIVHYLILPFILDGIQSYYGANMLQHYIIIAIIVLFISYLIHFCILNPLQKVIFFNS